MGYFEEEQASLDEWLRSAFGDPDDEDQGAVDATATTETPAEKTPIVRRAADRLAGSFGRHQRNARQSAETPEPDVAPMTPVRTAVLDVVPQPQPVDSASLAGLARPAPAVVIDEFTAVHPSRLPQDAGRTLTGTPTQQVPAPQQVPATQQVPAPPQVPAPQNISAPQDRMRPGQPGNGQQPTGQSTPNVQALPVQAWQATTNPQAPINPQNLYKPGMNAIPQASASNQADTGPQGSVPVSPEPQGTGSQGSMPVPQMPQGAGSAQGSGAQGNASVPPVAQGGGSAQGTVQAQQPLSESQELRLRRRELRTEPQLPEPQEFRSWAEEYGADGEPIAAPQGIQPVLAPGPNSWDDKTSVSQMWDDVAAAVEQPTETSQYLSGPQQYVTGPQPGATGPQPGATAQSGATGPQQPLTKPPVGTPRITGPQPSVTSREQPNTAISQSNTTGPQPEAAGAQPDITGPQFEAPTRSAPTNPNAQSDIFGFGPGENAGEFRWRITPDPFGLDPKVHAATADPPAPANPPVPPINTPAAQPLTQPAASAPVTAPPAGLSGLAGPAAMPPAAAPTTAMPASVAKSLPLAPPSIPTPPAPPTTTAGPVPVSGQVGFPEATEGDDELSILDRLFAPTGPLPTVAQMPPPSLPGVMGTSGVPGLIPNDRYGNDTATVAVPTQPNGPVAGYPAVKGPIPPSRSPIGQPMTGISQLNLTQPSTSMPKPSPGAVGTVTKTPSKALGAAKGVTSNGAPNAGSGSGKRIALIVVAVIVALAVLFGMFMLGRALANVTTTKPKPSAAASVATVLTPAAPGTHSWEKLAGGECIQPYTSPWAEEFTVVDCTVPHAAQLVYRGTFPGDAKSAYPGADALGAQMATLCRAEGVFNPDAIAPIADLQVQASYPADAKQWKNSRVFECFASRSGGTPLTASIAGANPTGQTAAPTGDSAPAATP